MNLRVRFRLLSLLSSLFSRLSLSLSLWDLLQLPGIYIKGLLGMVLDEVMEPWLVLTMTLIFC